LRCNLYLSKQILNFRFHYHVHVGKIQTLFDFQEKIELEVTFRAFSFLFGEDEAALVRIVETRSES
jgi:hypothetical protein